MKPSERIDNRAQEIWSGDPDLLAATNVEVRARMSFEKAILEFLDEHAHVFAPAPSWPASEWGAEKPGYVVVNAPGIKWHIPHEDHIETLIPDAPNDLKSYVRAEVLAHRPLAGNEFRSEGGMAS